MIEIPYTNKKLEECIGFQDVMKDPFLQNRPHRASAASAALGLLKAGTVFNGCLRQINLGKDVGYVFNNLSSSLVSRLVSKNIRANYYIKQSDRQTIISNSTTLFKEGSPFHVYRFDIKKFYESVDRKILSDKLMSDGRCSWQTLVLLSKFFKVLDASNVIGLPRGLGISATLSEFYLNEFDLKVKSAPGVFYYARFVDDILIVTSGEIARSKFEAELEELLPEGLEFHRAGKRVFHPVARASKDDKQEEQEKVADVYGFDFLGYHVRIYTDHSTESVGGHFRRRVTCDISKEKIARIKGRLISSFASYLSSLQYPTDFMLLKNRIRALTGNYHIVDPMTGVEIKTGIYYNYVHKNFVGGCALDELDVFLRGLLFSANHKFSRKILQALSAQRRRELAGYSFKSGFVDGRFHYFKYDTLKKIKECWRK
ncbi:MULTISPECIES: antiviral reverse transcriptase Drt3a [unclassified Pseudomonas]|uniref:antiviral reverse transcriptase Drt3a n=1 Tax=unclassified Pseudomonas TaxID=196821 RepID=UPI001586D0F6|nr:MULTISPECIES: antiviral reverse transcriptase Drt3a [unclassified Pseudomonas]